MRRSVTSMLVVAAFVVAALPAPAAAATPRVSASSVDYDCADFANQAESEEYLPLRAKLKSRRGGLRARAMVSAAVAHPLPSGSSKLASTRVR